MGEIIKKDFNGEDLRKKIRKNPEKTAYYIKFLEDINCSELNLDGFSPEEIYKIGKDHEKGENSRKWDRDIAKKYYQAAAERGCVDAMLEVANEYKSAAYPFYSKALYWYKKAAENGSVKAKCFLGGMYDEGEGIEQDFKQAAWWYEEAGKSGVKDVQIRNSLGRAGIIYYHGEEGVARDRAKAAECFKKAVECADGDETPNYYLGLLYMKGDNVEKDYAKARICFETAVKQGYFAALEGLDYLYETGKIQDSKYKYAAQWYIDTNENGKAAEQLGYVYVYNDKFLTDMTDYHKRIFSALPEDSLLSRVTSDLCGTEEGYKKGIFWYETASETLYQRAFYQLISIFIYNRDNKKTILPSAEKIAYFINKFFPLEIKDKNISFNKVDCDLLIGKLLILSEMSRQNGAQSLADPIKDEENIFIKYGLMMASEGVDIDIIKVINGILLDIDNKEGIDLLARQIIIQGIISIQQREKPDILKLKLLDILGEEISALEEEWELKNVKSYNAEVYFERGRIYCSRGNPEAAIADFQTAMDLTKNFEEQEKFFSWLAKTCQKKQDSQTLYTRMAPYSQMIEKIKNETSEPIHEIIKFKKIEEIAELAAALALFEEYGLLNRLLYEAAKYQLSILNTRVSPQFAFWGPSPLYFITTKRSWRKMEEPKKMLKFLVDNGADINFTAADKSTALLNQTCRDCESVEILQALLERGANPNLPALFQNSEWTPLVHCLAPDFIEEEIDGKISEVIIPFNDLAISQARLLLEYDADPNLASPSMSDYPPLIMAIRYGFISKGGPTAGESAFGVLKFIEYLIELGADVNFKDSENNTPFSIAQDNNLYELMDILLKHGALAS